MILKTKDNAEGQLNASINASTTTIVLKAGEGALFPQPTLDAATSLGSSTSLPRTGAAAGLTNISVGDPIYNITDGSQAWVIAINTNDIETTPLHGGTDNTWESSDAFVVNPFVVTLNSRDANGNITDYEEVLIHNRATDTLTAATSGGRGYNSTTPDTWDSDDYVSLFVTSPNQEGLEAELYQIEKTKFENDFSQPVANNTTFKARNNADSANIDLFKLTTGDILEFQTLARNPSSRSISNDYDIIDKKYFDDNLPGVSIESKAEASAIAREIFENTDDSNNLAWKDSGSTIHYLVDRSILSDETNIKYGTATVNPGSTGVSNTITHNLGRVPKLITIEAYFSGSSTVASKYIIVSKGRYDGSTYVGFYNWETASNQIQHNAMGSNIIVCGRRAAASINWSATITNNLANSFEVNIDAYNVAQQVIIFWRVE